MKKAAAFFAFLALLGPGPRPQASAQVAAPGGFPFAFQGYRLRNGLRVILSVDDSLPLVTVAVAYSAGTMREKPGQEGLAYLVENLMFQGSENVAPLQHVGYVQKVGGELNATTSVDKTLFYQTLPSNYLALALWLESDRMKSLAITPAAIENTRAELIQEHRDRLANDPYLESFSLFDELLYPDYLYGHPLIAGGAAMQALTREEVMDFHGRHYAPNNAVLCIVGNIEIGRTKELVARYFDTIPPGTDIPTPPRPLFLQEDEVVRSLPGGLSSSGFHLGFRFFPLQTGDVYSLRILEYVLLRGETSRLRSRLLGHDPVLAHHLSGGLEERQGVLGLKIFCLTANDAMAERARRAILTELERFRTSLVPVDELDKAKILFKKDYLMAFSTRLGKALFLVDAALSGRPLDGLGGDLDKHMRVNPQTLMALVTRHMLPRNKVVLELRQK
jgi:zinc protease